MNEIGYTKREALNDDFSRTIHYFFTKVWSFYLLSGGGVCFVTFGGRPVVTDYTMHLLLI